MCRRVCLLLPLLLTALCAQNNPGQDQTLQEILRRIDALEQQNRQLMEEIKQLKQAQMSAAPTPPAAPAANPPTQPPLEERVQVTEARVAEQAQTKVEASQKFPVSLYGT